MKLKGFCITEETFEKMKRQLTEREKIFANDMTNMGLKSNICKQLIQLKI